MSRDGGVFSVNGVRIMVDGKYDMMWDTFEMIDFLQN